MSGPVGSDDHAIAENCFRVLERKRVNRFGYRTRDEACADPLEYIAAFYDRMRRNDCLGNSYSMTSKYDRPDNLECSRL